MLRRRKRQIDMLYEHIAQLVKMRSIEDIKHGRPHRWRIEMLCSVSKLRMFFSAKPIKLESFYPNSAFIQPTKEEKGDGTMYLLMAYIAGVWGFAGVDPHEECAVMFIDQIDSHFGEGSAYVVKLPDKPGDDDDDSNPTNLEMANLLSAIQTGDFDFDEALAKFNQRHD